MAGERGKKGITVEERREGAARKEKKDRQGVLWGRGMRAVKAFGVFIRLPKPRAPLPIRLVDTASHVNEMQSRREKKRERERPWLPFANFLQNGGPFALPPPMAFAPFISLSSSRHDDFPTPPPHPHPPLSLPATSDSSALTRQDNDLAFFSPRFRSLSWTLHFSNVPLQGFNPHRLYLFIYLFICLFISEETAVVIKHMLFLHVCREQFACECVCVSRSCVHLQYYKAQKQC